MNSKVFVTGGSGLLGSALVARLLESGCQVTALLRNASNPGALQGLLHRVTVVEGDVLDAMLLRKVLSGHQQVVHAAAVVSFAPSRRVEMHEINVGGTSNMVNAALESGIERFAHISSVAALGRTNRGKIIDEEAKWETSKHNSHYGFTKYLAELEVFRAGEEGLNFFMVNPSIILAPGHSERSSGRLIEQVRKGGLFYPSGTINYVDVRDVCDAVMHLMQSDLQGRFVLNGGHIAYNEFMRQLAQRLGVRAPKYSAGKWLTGLAWRAEALRCMFTRKEPLLTAETARASLSTYRYSALKYKNAFGAAFRTIDDTLEMF